MSSVSLNYRNYPSQTIDRRWTEEIDASRTHIHTHKRAQPTMRQIRWHFFFAALLKRNMWLFSLNGNIFFVPLLLLSWREYGKLREQQLRQCRRQRQRWKYDSYILVPMFFITKSIWNQIMQFSREKKISGSYGRVLQRMKTLSTLYLSMEIALALPFSFFPFGLLCLWHFLYWHGKY